MPNMAATTKVRNFWPTLMSRSLYAASVPANAAKVPITACRTTLSPRLLRLLGDDEGVDGLAERAERDALEGRERDHQRRARPRA